MNDERSVTNGTEGPGPVLGWHETFAPGTYERTERVLDDLATLGVEHLRVTMAMDDAHAEADRAWQAWLLPRLTEQVKVLPYLAPATPASFAAQGPSAYAPFVGRMIERFGECFDTVELATAFPDGWDGSFDRPDAPFAAVARAVEEARVRGKHVVLGGVGPSTLRRLDRMGHEGLLRRVDAIGIHALHGGGSHATMTWNECVQAVRDVLKRHDTDATVWITSTGNATQKYDEYHQLQAFVETAAAPVERLYWSTVQRGTRWEGERAGLRERSGRPTLLFRIWAEHGEEAVAALAHLGDRGRGKRHPVNAAPAGTPRNGQRPVLITGGAGFIGANLAHRLLADGRPVLIYDNLARPGVERNLHGLVEEHGALLSWQIADVRDAQALREAVRHAAHVFHFAGQVAVTTSLEQPEADFAVNARGTLNLLEALRALSDPPPLVFTSTNKVYGRLDDLTLHTTPTRYVPADERVRTYGISETRRIGFHSPYGCSKGAAEQYVLDYARTYDLPALVFRMSCIYGTRQFGTEDQGWVAHFVQRTLEDQPITLYGDGRQVRDILFVEDLVRALRAAHAQAEELAGEAFNIGGGPRRAVSLRELIDLTAELHGSRPPVHYAEWRQGDQKYFVADTRKFARATGWTPEVGIREGVERLYRWLERSRASMQYPFTMPKEA